MRQFENEAIMRYDRQNYIILKSPQVSFKTVEFYEILEEKRKYVIARQLLKSGTSIGANTREAQNTESKIDFIRKLKIAPK